MKKFRRTKSRSTTTNY